MRIKTSIYLGALPTLLLLAAVLVLLGVTQRQVQNAALEDARLEQVLRSVFELVELRNEYLMRRTERIRNQWEIRDASLVEAINQLQPAGAEEIALVERLREDHAQARILFERLTEPPAASHDEAARREYERRLSGQLEVVAQRRLNNALKLAELTQSRLRGLYVRTQLVMVMASVLATGLAVANALVIQRKVLSPIRKLREATRRVGSGRLEYRIAEAARDELGDLSRAFDEMTRNLGEVTASRDELNREVHERQQAEDGLRERTAELTRSNAELEQFAYVASHDLQEPLRKIQAFGNLLVTGYREKLDEQGRDYLDRMQRAAERMQALINDLLLLSRVLRKGEPFRTVDLGQVVQSVLTDLESRIGQSGGHVEVGPLPTIEADPTQMGQLFQNLIGNALKYHRPDTPPRVTMRAEPVIGGGNGTGGAWRIEIRDNGIGFEQKYAEQIFQPFQRLHGRSAYEGTGMGLAICRRIVERHRGAIVAEGRPGEGAKFIVTLPKTQPTGTGARNHVEAR